MLLSYVSEFELVEFNQVLLQAGIHVMLVDHKEFKLSKPNSTSVVDTEGVW